MSTPDLTRWNRAGLDRIRYVEGNAVTHLETLRRRLAEEFPGWDAVRGPAAEESPAVAQERRHAAYQAPPGDAGHELARALARACHVLTEAIDAQANESLLPTATQWENVRRLVAMLGYTPAPPASAHTPLELHAKPGATGRVRAGLALDHSPPGASPIVFETLEDIDVDAALNALRPEGHDRNPHELTGASITLAGRIKGLSGGQPVVLEKEGTDELHVHVIRGVRELADRTELTVAPPVAGLQAGSTVVHAVPADRLAVLGPAQTDVNELGPTIELRDAPTGLFADQVVAISDGGNTYLRRVQRVRDRRVVLVHGVGMLELDTATIAPAEQVSVTSVHQAESAGTESRLLIATPGVRAELIGRRVAVATSGGELLEATVVVVDHVGPVPSTGERMRADTTELTLLRTTGPQLVAGHVQALFAATLGPGARLDAPLLRQQSRLPRIMAVARPKKTVAGDIAVLHRAGALGWGRLDAVTVDPDGSGAQLTFGADLGEHGAGGPFFLADSVVHAHFGVQARVHDWDRNDCPLTGDHVPLATLPPALVRGRRVIARRLDAPGAAVVTTVAAANATGVTLAGGLPAGSGRGNLVLAANVVPAGHGKRAAERVLGSGDATANDQRFVLEARAVSFVADPTQPAGVRADVEVMVDGRRWAQVATLADSSAEDPHYEVRLAEDGRLLVGFGDGRHGRRLPTGADNVRIAYREGAGLAGLLPAGTLDRELRGQPLLAAARQPLAAVGGNDREEVGSLRENAPAALLTLDRAVSLSDYADVAGRHASVWQARAVADPIGRGRREGLTVHVVPAGGGELGSELKATLEHHLLRHGAPGVAVTVERYGRLGLYCAVTVRVDLLAYEAESVARATRRALLEALTLPTRRLGQSLSRSDVMRVAEAVPGVENSTCVIGLLPESVPADRLPAAPDEVIAVPADHAGPFVTVEAALP
jgi:hypothetical protein